MSSRVSALRALLVFLVFACFLPTYSLAEIIIITHPSNETRIDKMLVTNLFLGKRTTFYNGKHASPIQPKSGKSRKDFFKYVLERNEARVNSYWARMLFTGQARLPQQAEDDAAVKAAVAANPEYIGYIDSKNLDGSVRAIRLKAH